MHKAINPTAWVADDTGFCKDGRLSPCVARQYTGTAGKITNCQVATTLHLACDDASVPIDWRLFMPESWDPDSDKASLDVHQRRAASGIPDDEHHRPKWQLALECVDEALSWEVPPPPVLAADAGYGDAAAFRHGLTDRNIAYAVQISVTLSVLPATATRTTAPYSGRGPHPKPRYEQDPVSVKAHIMALGRRRARRITWRIGSRQQDGQPRLMSGRFVFCRVLQADAGTREIYKGQDWPECWLIAEWPPGAPEPTRYWLSTLPATARRADLVRAAKQRWRIEHDYRELKTGLGLDHYEGRKWAGWHHHVTLVAAAHGFLTLQRLNPKAPVPE
jgi:SRSO17 transposase